MTRSLARRLATPLFFSAALALGGPAAYSQSTPTEGMFVVPGGGTEPVSRWNVCRIIANSGGQMVLVPTLTSPEWNNGSNAFLNNIGGMQGISVTACPNPSSMDHSISGCNWCHWDGSGPPGTKPSDLIIDVQGTGPCPSPAELASMGWFVYCEES